MTMTAGWLFLKKEFSPKSGVLFLLCFFVLLPILFYSVHVRMYTWALFFVTMTVFSMWNAVKTDKTRWWSAVGVFIAVSAWTHYYAALAVAVAGGGLFFHAIKVGNRKQIYKVLLSGAGGIVLFLPWFPVVTSSFFAAKNNFWFPAFNLQEALFCFLFSFRGSAAWDTGFLLMSFFGTLLVFFQKRRKSKGELYIFSGVCCWFLVYVIAVGVAVFVAPMLVSRYLLPVVALPWLFFAVECSLACGGRFFTVLCAVFFFMGIEAYIDMLEGRRRSNEGFSKLSEILATKMDRDDVLVFPSSNKVMGDKGAEYSYYNDIVACFLPENAYLHTLQPPWIPKLTKHLEHYNTQEIPDMTKYNKRRMWFFLAPPLGDELFAVPEGVEFYGKFTWFPYGWTHILYVYRAQKPSAVKEMFERIAVLQSGKKALVE
jgi:hypothetical protein